MANGKGHNGGFDPYRDSHGRWASGAGLSGAPSGAPRITPDLGGETEAVTIKQGTRTVFQIWHRGELVHEQPATIRWREEQTKVVDLAKTYAKKTTGGALAVINENIRQRAAAATTRLTAPKIDNKRQLELTQTLVENHLAANPLANENDVRRRARSYAEQLAHNPTLFEQVSGSQRSRQNQRELDWENTAVEKTSIYTDWYGATE